mmetsp:Transcript_28904/g.42847  ORF Transcript_28904/g.42847 Transcript_28904/m.42847 type:complete len:289 (+) Transcript_28904:44-910(+)|eukprot:CAMPEP_0195527184 /NCGR_PEP_ID=MMETSP0794_2-20130614/28700_1 /TAXON_ID=515487 /ORGANISM="Stephanopyxis turris, Strain CCMP 815" /LENGTH=288 /DNA_ID=CAMNT_0040658043 /DNA_START=31 /DNA_END=897 /DNA_ORIENTATION=+
MIHYGKLLTICAFHPNVWGTTAFTIKGPMALTRQITTNAKSGSVVLHSISPAEAQQADDGPLDANIWSMGPAATLQGNTLKTWQLGVESTKRVQLSIKGNGRPLDANVELWHTPSYIPTKMKVYTEDSSLRPVNTVIETPKHPNTVAVFNTGSMEFPFSACVAETGLASAYSSLSATGPGERVQGGRIVSYTFDSSVESVQVLLKTDERNMKATIELTQGPNQVKQIFDIYASSGYKNPFYAVIETPGSGNVIRVINGNTVEFPFDAWVQPYKTGSAGNESDPVIGGL